VIRPVRKYQSKTIQSKLEDNNMQSKKRYNIYLKSKDDKDQLRRGLNNMINQMVGDSQSPGKIDKLVLKLAETLIILDVNTIPSRATLKRLLEEIA
jgi:hypothetical protein